MKTFLKFAAITALINLGAGSAILADPAAGPISAEGKVEPDGTLIVPEYRLPQSQLLSDTFRQEYADYVNARPFSPPPAMDAPKAEWDKFDADYDRMLSAPIVAHLKQAYPVDVVETRMGGVSVAVITPKGGVKPHNRNRVLINVHGGGFFAGRGLVTGQMESIPIAALGGIKVVTVDYRMAPYFKYPAASEDSEAVYRELLKSHKPGSIGIFGCSAGGALAAQSLAWYRSKRLPRPGAVGIFCLGIADPRQGPGSDTSMWAPASGVPWQGPLERAVSKTRQGGYLSTADENDPRAYPGVSDDELARFPPTLFFSGTRAFEMSSVIVSHARLLRLGVDSQLYLQEGGPHGSILTHKRAPETRDAYAYIAKWFNQKLKN